MNLGHGTLACIFAFGSMGILGALALSGNRYGEFFDFFVRLVLSIAMGGGLLVAVRGLSHPLRRERVLAILAGIVMMALLLITIPSVVDLAQKIRWGGHGWTPFM
jgi:hypothetical protein